MYDDLYSLTTMEKPIYFFDDELPFYELSNFSPHGFDVDGVCWPTVEHYFQAQKFPGHPYQETIRNALTPEQAKQWGQSRDVPLRPDWEQVKDAVMKEALRRKFSAPELRTLLLNTGCRPLVERSPVDRYWGSGPELDGLNRAGVLLAEVREELRRAVEA